jgi:hypothetical protein
MINGEDVLKPSIRLSPIPELPTPESEKIPIIDSKIIKLEESKPEESKPEESKPEEIRSTEIPVPIIKKSFWCC